MTLTFMNIFLLDQWFIKDLHLPCFLLILLKYSCIPLSHELLPLNKLMEFIQFQLVVWLFLPRLLALMMCCILTLDRLMIMQLLTFSSSCSYFQLSYRKSSIYRMISLSDSISQKFHSYPKVKQFVLVS